MFHRFAAPKFGYHQFCKIVLPIRTLFPDRKMMPLS